MQQLSVKQLDTTLVERLGSAPEWIQTIVKGTLHIKCYHRAAFMGRRPRFSKKALNLKETIVAELASLNNRLKCAFPSIVVFCGKAYVKVSLSAHLTTVLPTFPD